MATQQHGSHVLAPEELNEKSQRDAPSGITGDPQRPENKDQDAQARQDTNAGQEKNGGPEGGFDSTPIPSPSPGIVGYTVKITLHRATSLAIGDAYALSSDPYCLAQLNTGLPMRHKEDPNLRFRTPTIRKNTEPEWNEEWIIANVPSSGFKLKIRVYDEDAADSDDILGKMQINVSSITDDWPGIKNQPYQLKVRDSSKRALLIRAVARCFCIVEHLRGEIYVSIEVLGRTGKDGQNGRAYTKGPCRWIRHYSPMLGRIAHTKEPSENSERPETMDSSKEKRIQHYNFQANQMQLEGPVPPQLYHRFVEFKPWVKRMFTTSGFQGVVLGKALHHQHARVYNFDRSTIWGYFNQVPCLEMTRKFLDLVHYDQGGRIFTYVLTLDALWRFTETGKEFGIDMLSKHTMHSDVSIYIAFSGEFFIRRRKHHRRPLSPQSIDETSQQSPSTHEPNEVPEESGDNPSTDPSGYELIIDNDSGTYRPNADMLPLLASFLSKSLPGLHIQTLDCQADAEKMAKMKAEQRERKKREGDNIVYAQGDASSISSSEDERLDAIESGLNADNATRERHVSVGGGYGKEHGHLETIARDVMRHQKEKVDKVQRNYGPNRSQEDSSASQQ